MYRVRMVITHAADVITVTHVWKTAAQSIQVAMDVEHATEQFKRQTAQWILTSEDEVKGVVNVTLNGVEVTLPEVFWQLNDL